MGALLFIFVEAICSEAFLLFIIFLTVVLNMNIYLLWVIKLRKGTS